MKYRCVVSQTPRDRGIVEGTCGKYRERVGAGHHWPRGMREPLGKLNAREFHTILRNIFFFYGRKCCEYDAISSVNRLH